LADTPRHLGKIVMGCKQFSRHCDICKDFWESFKVKQTGGVLFSALSGNRIIQIKGAMTHANHRAEDVRTDYYLLGIKST